MPSLSDGRGSLVVYVGTRRARPEPAIRSSAVPFPAPLGPDITNSGGRDSNLLFTPYLSLTTRVVASEEVLQVATSLDAGHSRPLHRRKAAPLPHHTGGPAQPA